MKAPPADIMIAAMEMALADDMDILNMSIGSSFPWPQYPTAMAANWLVNTGMVVVASIGNSGESGTYSAGAPGVGEKVIGIASFDNTVATFPVFEVNGVQIGFNPMAFSADIPKSGTEEIVFVGQGCAGDDYLDDPDSKVALIVRGACSFVRTQRAYDAGATAVVVHNSNPGNFNGTLGEPPTEPQFALSISWRDGEYIRSLMGTDPVYLTWTEDVAPFRIRAAA